ncbi:MAG: hypothetical protein KGI79_03425 [Patescibacteria group bacterium]|nr:hypothetical protein [Patescibacteria group bacterium]
MYELNLGFDNKSLYRGCDVEEYEPGKFRLNTPLDSTLTIIAANMLEIVKSVPESKRGRLVLTGAVPPSIFMTAQSVLGPFFKQVEHFDGRRKMRVQIPPHPPNSHNGEPE